MTNGERQHPLPGLEDYVCTFQCLTHCPFPDGECIWDDPLIGCFDEVEYPEFFWWRIIHEEECSIKHTEPDNPMQIRCPRCLSVEVDIGYPYIECQHCGYNEPLIDYPENVGSNHD